MADIILSDAGEARVLEIMFTNANGVVKVEASPPGHRTPSLPWAAAGPRQQLEARDPGS